MSGLQSAKRKANVHRRLHRHRQRDARHGRGRRRRSRWWAKRRWSRRPAASARPPSTRPPSTTCPSTAGGSRTSSPSPRPCRSTPRAASSRFSGQRGINSNVSVDGADFNQPFFGGIRGGERSNNAFTIPQEAIQEFQVAAAGYSAGVRPVHGRPRQRDHQVGHQRDPRLRLLPEPEQGLGGDERLRAEGGADPAAVRRIHRRSAGQGQGLLLRRLREAALQEHAPGAVRPPLRLHRRPRPPRRPSPTTSRWRRRSTPPTTPGRAWPASTTSSTAPTASACATATATTRPSTRTPPATPSTRTRSARSATTAPRRTTPTSSSASSRAASARTMLLEVRGQWGREERPAPGQRGVAERDQRHRPLRDRQLPAHHPVRQALPGRAVNLTWIKNQHTIKVGTEYNHVFADQAFGFNQFGVFNVSGTDTATLLDTLGTGGAIANRFDVDHRDLPPPDRQPAGRLLDGRARLLRPGQLEGAARTSPSTPACAGKGSSIRRRMADNPTPAQRASRPSVSPSGGPPIPRPRSRTSSTSSGRASASPGTRPRTAGPPSAATAGIYYARTPALALRGPDQQLPAAAGRPLGPAPADRAPGTRTTRSTSSSSSSAST